MKHSHEEYVPGGLEGTSKNQSVKSKNQIPVVGSDETLSKEKMYKQMVNLYNDTDWQKSLPKALVLIQKLLKMDPADGMLYYYKGGSYLALSEYKKAIEALEKAKDMLEPPPKDLQQHLDFSYSRVENSVKSTVSNKKKKSDKVKTPITTTSYKKAINASEKKPKTTANVKKAKTSTSKPNTQKNKKLLAGLMGIFFGGFGIHKFVLGYKKPGLIMLIGSLVTFGILFYVFAIIGLIEGIIYLTKSDDDFYTTYQEEKKYWF